MANVPELKLPECKHTIREGQTRTAVIRTLAVECPFCREERLEKRLVEAEKLLTECLGVERSGLYALGKDAAFFGVRQEDSVAHRHAVVRAADIEKRVREWLAGVGK